MLKSISNLKGVKELTKNELINLCGGWRVTCVYPNGMAWGFNADSVQDAVGLDEWCQNTGGSSTVSNPQIT